MTAYAIIEASGTQMRVEPGRFYDVNRLANEVDSQLTIDKVLFVKNEGDITVGQPLVAGATVEVTVLRHLRGRKIIVYKMQPKKKTRKKQGHRQELTRIMVNSISLNGEVVDSKEEPRVDSISLSDEVVDSKEELRS
ncbi:50S ribosomal protein L21 [Phormidesmis priestleyi ULC007]|uniref:Large ribosomal subunit protein bL21 n=1 Tax=Phormidesmis priestleyi ULC007 TaxID=1920490 RepID=A0A2T1DHL9_9CYAN|nr:50S ribosomal protein L21 [Phormidesmis priestleyi]PSB19978.1 50S ribosomal protein L21 [Phormidesmis priestleyi ULC007]PZO50324.1 MAG: 50S ribosomal protein L21 [Phormidesmis priestleyi]